jgi:hypothetical protein
MGDDREELVEAGPRDTPGRSVLGELHILNRDPSPARADAVIRTLFRPGSATKENCAPTPSAIPSSSRWTSRSFRPTPTSDDPASSR